MQPLLQRRAIEHRGPGVDVDRFAIYPIKARRSIHPAVRADHKHRGQHAGYADDHTACPMSPGLNAVPAIKKNPQRDRLEEKGGAFPGERQPCNGPRVLHELRPEKAQLKRKDRAGNSSRREENSHALGPCFGETQVNRILGLEPTPMGNRHEKWHGDADGRKNDVKSERNSHLRTRRQEICHKAN